MMGSLWTRMVRPRPSNPAPTPLPVDSANRHRAEVLAMRLDHAGLCSASRADRLNGLGIHCCGDLLTVDLGQVAAAFGSPRRALRSLRRYRQSVRLAASINQMGVRDAILLVTIHRRDPVALSNGSAGLLHRDLVRLAESTVGQRLYRGRRPPSIRRLRRWITEAQTAAQMANA